MRQQFWSYFEPASWPCELFRSVDGIAVYSWPDGRSYSRGSSICYANIEVVKVTLARPPMTDV
jgi:hypothetical protein